MWAGQQRTTTLLPGGRLQHGAVPAVLGGHGESLRRTRGEAAGEELGTALVDRSMVNVGTLPGSPSPLASQAGGGQARRRLLTLGGDGVPVVVGGRESRPHASHGWGMAKGDSESAAVGLAGQEDAGEHWRAPCSYGFRPGRRAQDAIAEVHLFTSRSYEWVVEGDITACFDELSHVGITGRLRRRVGDKRVLALVKAFLKAGILSEDGAVRDTITGTPQGGILSPLLSNLALSVLDDHYAEAWQAVGATSSARQWHRRKGLATWRLVRYADDCAPRTLKEVPV